MVNLEVVRSRPDQVDSSLHLFVRQAVDQAEESVRRAESTILLLTSLVEAIDQTGALRVEIAGPGKVQLGPEVILSIPENTSGTN